MIRWFKHQTSESEQALLEMLKADLAWKQARIEQLTQQIVEMRREGFTWTPPQETPKRENDIDPRIMAAIRSRAKEGSSLEGDLFTYAESQLILGGEIEDVVDAILSGRQVD